MKPIITYMDPQEMLSAAEKEMAPIPQDELFNDPKYQKLKERWCAGTLGVGYSKYVNQCMVGVNEDRYREDVDIFLKTEREAWEFQLAEVQQPGRRRGLEYQRMASGELRTIGYDPDDGKLLGSSWLVEGARRKVAKRYANSESMNLLLYANFPARELQYDELVVKLQFLSETFSSVWIISSEYISSVFSSPALGEVKGWGLMRRIHEPYP